MFSITIEQKNYFLKYLGMSYDDVVTEWKNVEEIKKNKERKKYEKLIDNSLSPLRLFCLMCERKITLRYSFKKKKKNPQKNFINLYDFYRHRRLIFGLTLNMKILYEKLQTRTNIFRFS